MYHLVVHFPIKDFAAVVGNKALAHIRFKYDHLHGKCTITLGPISKAEMETLKEEYQDYRCIEVTDV